jgi:hypothetical protein
VDFLSTLDKEEAHVFTKLCGFLWHIGAIAPLVYDLKHDIYKHQQIDFPTLSHLDSIGLIRFDPLAGFTRTGLPKNFTTSYYDTELQLELPNNSDNSISVGKVMLTHVGYQLAPIAGGQRVNGFVDYVREKWKNLKYLKEDTPPQASSPDPILPVQK